MGAAVIRPAVLRDASYVLAHMRPADVEEVMCQVPPNTKRHELAYNLLMGCEAYTAHLEDKPDQPIAFFGTSPINVACLSVWALGTVDVWRAVPAINRFMVDEHLPDRMRQGYLTMEARSLDSHLDAHRWLIAMGGVQHGGPFEFGANREKFLLFRWSSSDLEGIRNKRRRAK